MRKTVIFDGAPHEARTPTKRDVRQGAILRHSAGRMTYRLLCCDGDEAILRNVRFPDRITAWSVDDLLRDFLVLA